MQIALQACALFWACTLNTLRLYTSFFLFRRLRGNAATNTLCSHGNADAMEYAATNILCSYLSVATADAMEYAAMFTL
jgi:hypothetical protein